MSVLVKICGLTNIDDSLDAIELGADFLGFNFYKESPRYIEPDKAIEIFQEIPGQIKKVGIFVNEDPQVVINTAVELELDFIQFHGDESPAYCNAFGRPWMKAFRLKDEKDIEVIPQYDSSWLLVDAFAEKAFGGTGIVSNWDLAKRAKTHGLLFLSGGLTPSNVEQAIDAVHPYAVDVASGVEHSPGVKDRYKMEEFILRAKKIDIASM